MTIKTELQATITDLVVAGKGILAADESAPTIAKRFKAINVESTEANRCAWRSLLLATPGLGEFISGVILFEETLGQTTPDGKSLPEVAAGQGIVPGIKVDKGFTPLTNAPGDVVTQGLDGLAERLAGYKEQGARFAKWREVYSISPHNPTQIGLETNAEVLARYAAVCQSLGLVPIVEPEVLLDGDHAIGRCFEVVEIVQQAVFHALHRHRVELEYIVLKPSMVVPGKDAQLRAGAEEIAEKTLTVMRRSVPAAVPSINFLSGGQTPEEATANLNAINAMAGNAPWQLSFSYGRALQQPVLEAWQGKPENVSAAQQALYKRARLNGAARYGQYSAEMEQAQA
ncbi:MAG: fructose-bisphosphate aldolase class I [Methylovulum sp.]|uniref:class I fructose-bisphosphate aldolase n=1 Tax=Methylovulum sp. TaxID=1916980 RepID=UPI0026048356|nr:class I fructose-bisphosphate aldolase [Methylovulum sp.]MDD2724942.1 fructose-bisphosphate aldolase class I [Methylovulum sp.]MDD5123534.1 fructose-bisphosphate aldolase class I [Methylovulum sp.]